MNTNNHKLVVLGAGESGVGAALLGIRQGWDVFVSDGGTIRPEHKETLLANGIPFEEGRHTIERILAAGCLVKSPGISGKAEIVRKIKSAGIEICSEIEFGYRYKGSGKIIAITGSNGKTTTSALTWHIMKNGGADVSLCGNIGHSFARQLAEAPTEWYVLELSSFQLDDIHRFRPDIAVLLNITPDHLDRYDYNMELYTASKFRITENQTQSDFLIINQDDPVIRAYLTNHSFHAKQIPLTMNEQHLPDEGAYIKDEQLFIQYGGEEMNASIHDLSIKGKHNQYNSMAAGISAHIAGIRRDKIRESFATFSGIEHRLEYVATIRGVKFINDSKATNVNSVWYALESMKEPTVLILGGQDKGNDYSELLELVREKVKAIVCIGMDNTAIHETFSEAVSAIVDADTMKDAVQAAYALADKDDTVLLSPACASFDRFKDYEDRGRQFKEAVHDL